MSRQPDTDLRAAMKNTLRGVENELEVRNANQLKDEFVFDRQSTGRGKRSKLKEINNERAKK